MQPEVRQTAVVHIEDLCDNGPEFRSFEVNEWSERHGVRLVYSRSGKPTDNCFCERFNGTLRNECLNVYYFESLDEATASWRIKVNRVEVKNIMPPDAILEAMEKTDAFRT